MQNSLLPPNATPLERAIETVIMTQLQSVPITLRDLWHPDRCPEHLLPWLAYTVSVDDWDEEWSEAQKRGVIKGSLAIHRKKGTRGALEDQLSALGYRYAIQEWFENPKVLLPYQFDITVGVGFQIARSQDVFLQVIRRIEKAKNVRSQVRQLTVETQDPNPAKTYAACGLLVHAHYYGVGRTISDDDLFIPPDISVINYITSRYWQSETLQYQFYRYGAYWQPITTASRHVLQTTDDWVKKTYANQIRLELYTGNLHQQTVTFTFTINGQSTAFTASGDHERHTLLVNFPEITQNSAELVIETHGDSEHFIPPSSFHIAKLVFVTDLTSFSKLTPAGGMLWLNQEKYWVTQNIRETVMIYLQRSTESIRPSQAWITIKAIDNGHLQQGLSLIIEALDSRSNTIGSVHTPILLDTLITLKLPIYLQRATKGFDFIRFTLLPEVALSPNRAPCNIEVRQIVMEMEPVP